MKKWALIAGVLIFLFVFFLLMAINPLGNKQSDSQQQQTAQEAPKEASQESSSAERVFEGKTMTVTLKKVESVDALKSVQVSLMAQNNSNTECSFYIDQQTSTVNNTNVTPLGGSLATVKPGNNVALVYQVPYMQFGASSFNDVASIDFDITQYSGDIPSANKELDSVHVSYTK